MKKEASPTELSEMITSLGDPSRLRLLRLLERQELSVGEVAKVFQIPQSTASRQLKILAEAGWLSRRAEGTATYYSMIADDLTEAGRAVWGAVRGTMGRGPELEEDDRRVQGVLAERRTDSVGYFGRVRGEWDHVRAELFGGRFTTTALLALIRPDWVVADIGCGTGNVAELLSPVVEHVIAIDQSEPMLSAAQERLGGATNVSFTRASVEGLPIEQGSVDAAVCMLVLHHIDDPSRAVSEVRRVLRPDRGGGVLALVDMLAHDREDYKRTMGHKHLGFSRETIEGVCLRAGFKSVYFSELPSEPDAKGPGLFVATARV